MAVYGKSTFNGEQEALCFQPLYADVIDGCSEFEVKMWTCVRVCGSVERRTFVSILFP